MMQRIRWARWFGVTAASCALLAGCGATDDDGNAAPRPCMRGEDCAEGERCRGNICEVPRRCTFMEGECGVLQCSPLTGACEVCGGTPNICDFSVCQPGERQCGGAGQVQVCDAYGRSWLDELDCGSAGQVCFTGGVCGDPVCPPNTTYCKDDNVYHGVDGTRERERVHCVDEEMNDSACNPATVECEIFACDRPGETYCAGDAIIHCDETRFVVTVVEACPDELLCDPDALTCPEPP